jgi:muconolactone D-isomerase
MLYLVKCEVKSGYPLSPEEWLELVMKNMEDIMKYKEQGKIVVHGAPVGQQAGYMIWDVDSNSELQTLVTQLPVWPFMEWEIVPLISTEETIESVKQALASVQELKK